MKYEIIFYRSGKTAGLQLTIDKILNDAGFEIKNACAAADQKELGSCISAALKRSKLIIAVGQLNESDQSTEKLVSKLLVPKGSTTEKPQLKPVSEKSMDSFYIKSKGQAVIILPDDDEIINRLAQPLKKLVAKEFSTEITSRNNPAMTEIGEQLEKKLSGSARIKVLPKGSNAEDKNRKKLSTLRLIMIILLSLGVLEITGAVLLYIFFR